jgi:hypothetical protein
VTRSGSGSENAVTSADITAALHVLYPHADVAVEPGIGGEFVVTVPSATAREFGLGTRSRVAEWHLTRELGVRADITDVRVVTHRGLPSRTRFTIKLVLT